MEARSWWAPFAFAWRSPKQEGVSKNAWQATYQCRFLPNRSLARLGHRNNARALALRKSGRIFCRGEISARATAVIAGWTDFWSFAREHPALASRVHCSAILTRKGRTSVFAASCTDPAFRSSRGIISYRGLEPLTFFTTLPSHLLVLLS